MKTYYSQDGIEIYHGDCREVLPTLPKVDCVVTSPPYNTLPTSHRASGLHAERKSGVNKWIDRAVKGYADSMPEDDYQEWLRGIVEQCLNLCTGLVWINHKIRFRDGEAIHPARFLPFPLYSEIVWDRGASMALNCKRFAPSHEGVWGFGRPGHWNDAANTLMSVWRIPADIGADNHPCAHPISIPNRLITASCPETGLVLDPFCGSGTTLESAKHLGRRGIGIEKEERYCEIAAKRLAQGVLWGAA